MGTKSVRLTTSAFITKAQAVHGLGRYDYSETAYTRGQAKVRIICPQHGAFEQLAVNHTNKGCGCSVCRNAFLSRSKRSTTDCFITKAQAKHGVGVYDYSEVIYRTSVQKVVIVCPQHGPFEQIPNSHLQGYGCEKCAKDKRIQAQTHTAAHFIASSQAVHGIDTYDYSKTVYKGVYEKVTIICKAHGSFEQSANSHKRGSGCPACAGQAERLSWIEQAKGKQTTLYFIRVFNGNEDFYKIGITYQSIKARFKPSALPGYQYEILAQHISNNAAAVYDWEQSILETFAHLRYRPKSYFTGVTECFTSCEEILEIFPL